MQTTSFVASVYFLVFFSVIRTQRPFRLCKKLQKSPNFDIDNIVGRPWRFYFTWVMDYGERCGEITFKKLNRTSGITRRFANNMGKYMKDEVVWEDATLLLSKSPLIFREGEVTKEMLLFPKEQKGSFDGVHEIADYYSGYLPRRSVPLKQLILKLFRNGKYLLVADCKPGLAFLMARSNETIYRLDVLSLASEIWDDSGFTTCLPLKTDKEIEGLLIDNNKIM